MIGKPELGLLGVFSAGGEKKPRVDMRILFRQWEDGAWRCEGFKGKAAVNTAAFDRRDTKDVGPTGAQRDSEETEVDRWKLFWVWQKDSVVNSDKEDGGIGAGSGS